jgi:hypothetical protein
MWLKHIVEFTWKPGLNGYSTNNPLNCIDDCIVCVCVCVCVSVRSNQEIFHIIFNLLHIQVFIFIWIMLYLQFMYFYVWIVLNLCENYSRNVLWTK